MSLPPSVAALLRSHVTLEVEGIDRMYLNVYQPLLQTDFGVVRFFRRHRGAIFASSALMDRITRPFVEAIAAFAREHALPVLSFARGQRKDDVAKEHLARFEGEEGVLFIGKAQEKASVFRTERRRHPHTGQTYPWIVRSTAMVNQYYFYCVDEDFGPFFLKYCSCFPYNARLCINGHEYLKRQLEKEGIAYEALDNGILSCEDPKRLQEIADGLSAERVCDLLFKWQKRLPYPFASEDTAAGYRYALSILQAEFSLTQVLDRPVMGRLFFEQVIWENLDIGRPGQVQLVFERRVTKRTPGRFRTRVITDGVTPTLHADYKNARIKQYHKEGRALRTETTINDTRDLGVGRGIVNLPQLRQHNSFLRQLHARQRRHENLRVPSRRLGGEPGIGLRGRSCYRSSAGSLATGLCYAHREPSLPPRVISPVVVPSHSKRSLIAGRSGAEVGCVDGNRGKSRVIAQADAVRAGSIFLSRRA